MKSITLKGVAIKNVVNCKYQYSFVVDNIEYIGNTELTAKFGDPCLDEGEVLPVSYEKGKPEINKYFRTQREKHWDWIYFTRNFYVHIWVSN